MELEFFLVAAQQIFSVSSLCPLLSPLFSIFLFPDVTGVSGGR